MSQVILTEMLSKNEIENSLETFRDNSICAINASNKKQNKKGSFQKKVRKLLIGRTLM